MPGYNTAGEPDKAGGDYYCDAITKDHLCPELNAFVGNKYTFETALHTCPAAVNKHFDNCDGGICAANAYTVDATAFGPAKTIDSSKKFRISHAFGVDKTTGQFNNLN